MKISQAALESVRNWNKAFRIGQVVMFDGKEYRTWSHAALAGEKPYAGQPAVFLAGGPETPVPLHRLQVPGCEWTIIDKRKRPNARPEKAA